MALIQEYSMDCWVIQLGCRMGCAMDCFVHRFWLLSQPDRRVTSHHAQMTCLSNVCWDMRFLRLWMIICVQFKELSGRVTYGWILDPGPWIQSLGSKLCQELAFRIWDPGSWGSWGSRILRIQRLYLNIYYIPPQLSSEPKHQKKYPASPVSSWYHIEGLAQF